MDLTSEKLEQFIIQELENTNQIDDVITELDRISNVFDRNLEELEELVEKSKNIDEELADKIQVFYYQILDESSDLNFFIEELKHKYNYRN